jgi:hypothetical protein
MRLCYKLQIDLMTSRSPTFFGRQHGRIVRGVALFLLVYAFADTICPDYCCEELIGLRDVNAAVARAAGDSILSVRAQSSDDSQHRQDSGAIPGDEDCFCRSSVVRSASQNPQVASPQISWLGATFNEVITKTPVIDIHYLGSHSPPDSYSTSPSLNNPIRC